MSHSKSAANPSAPTVAATCSKRTPGRILHRFRRRLRTLAKAAQTSATPVSFREVCAAEYAEIHRRRWLQTNPDADSRCERARAQLVHGDPPANLHGLALSGGGIRSATFALGLLQGLHDVGPKLLASFDYISSVSGGGYTAAWWSAWLSRTSENHQVPRHTRPSPSALFPTEHIEPERWDQYGDTESNACPEGSFCAKNEDPIHHLRLFANYLTPRKGLLSADTWRAATVIIRNLLLTWCVMIPVVIVLVLLGQLFFAMCDENFVTLTTLGRLPAMHARVGLAAKPICVLLAWSALLSLLWMLNSIGRSLWSALGGVCSVVVMLGCLAQGFGLHGPTRILSGGWLGLCAAGVVLLLIVTVCDRRPRKGSHKPHTRETRRDRILRLQASLTVATAVTGVLLAIAGFSHDLHWFVFEYAPLKAGAGDSTLLSHARKAITLGAGALTVASGMFTVLKGAPSSTEDARLKRAPSARTQLVFAIAPPLLVLGIAIVAAIGSHKLIASATQDSLGQLVTATRFGIGLLLWFAAMETLQRESELSLARRIAIVGVPALLGLGFIYLCPAINPMHARWPALALLAAVLFILAVRLTTIADAQGRLVSRFRLADSRAKLSFVLILGVTLLFAGITHAASWTGVALPATDHDVRGCMALMITCGAFAIAETLLLNAKTGRAVMLVVLALFAICSLLLMQSFTGAMLAPSAGQIAYPTIIVSLAVIALCIVVGFGWLADPNQLSIHAFYQSRLVRAYLGASNVRRSKQEITDSNEDDDICLSHLRNCERGGPYHLINTTLNLVGGRDLTTAQRSADHFLLSQLYCGSSRTGYRPTSSYMGGALSLGTAMAVSGAAISPNMGSKTPSAALAMLLTFFNVRLGYWAPTPNRARWRSRQARLWPYYTLRESLSQTNALATYCYLTDGGHFDNTGIYALVARGCRVIIAADCGADPGPCFEDMGSVIRRCRIDFGTEITLALDELLPDGQRHSQKRVVFGTIDFSTRHLTALGWSADEIQANRRGVIVWVKPTLTGEDSIDVRQYGLENGIFPQQTTADQWFDEAQFESYRRLGAESARAVLEDARYTELIALHPNQTPSDGA